jgi:arabinan endo-1,5-alpha-L-arabinosidase
MIWAMRMRFLMTVWTVLSLSSLYSQPALSQTAAKTYTNPLSLYDPATGPVISCPDPAIIKETLSGVDNWYLFCTGDPLNTNDTNPDGSLKNHYISSFHSLDLIHWVYIGDVFPSPPAWADPNSNLWAPAVKHFNGQYYCYFTAPSTIVGGSAIGVATAASPAGPWTDSGQPLIPPSARATIDPDEVQDSSGQRYISFGSFYGGISIERLSPDGLTADPTSIQQIAIDNRYEGGSFYKRGDYYYLFASATNCCNGPLSGYSVFVGRAFSPRGPFVDQNGVSLTTFATGGTVGNEANGNHWVGPGGNVVFDDDSGQSYMLYHAIDLKTPYFPLNPGFTRRPALIDPIEWVDGWPLVRSGYGPSFTPQPAPAAQPGEVNGYRPPPVKPQDQPGTLITSLSDEFNTTALSSQWHFIHPQADNSYVLTGSAYQVMTQGPDENSDPTQVSILGEPIPTSGDYLVETSITTSVPFDDTCCYNYAQGALFIYGNDLNSIKTDVFPSFDTRQTEFGKQVGPVAPNYPTYGNSVIGPPGPTTFLRIAMHRSKSAGESYTAYSSVDGLNWTRGSTWTHSLGGGAQIGISAENTSGFTMGFDYVRVYTLSPAAE